MDIALAQQISATARCAISTRVTGSGSQCAGSMLTLRSTTRLFRICPDCRKRQDLQPGKAKRNRSSDCANIARGGDDNLVAIR